MLALASVLAGNAGLLLVVGAGVACYAAARGAADAVAGDAPAPDALALAHWAPVALVGCLAALMGRPDVAVAVAFGSSVAALSLALGLVTLNAMGTNAAAEPAPLSVRAWAMVLPAALLALVGGFSGRITPVHALFLAGQGVAILSVWRGTRAVAAGDADAPVPAIPLRPRLDAFRLAQLALAIVLALIGAWAAVSGAVRMGYQYAIMTPALVGSAVVSPLLTLPMIGTGTLLSRVGRPRAATGAIVGIVLLNLCALVPLVVGLSLARPFVIDALGSAAVVLEPPAPAFAPSPDDAPDLSRDADADAAPTTSPTTTATTTPTTTPTTAPATTPAAGSDVAAVPDEPPPDPWDGIAYPMPVWRLDTVLLVVLSLLLVPVALRGWTLGPREGIVLVIAYALYLAMSAIVGRRW